MKWQKCKQQAKELEKKKYETTLERNAHKMQMAEREKEKEKPAAKKDTVKENKYLS